MPEPTPAKPADAREAVVSLTGPALRSVIGVGDHRLTTDEPDTGDEGPSPVELTLAALGACKVMTARLYADRKGWPLAGATARVRRVTDAPQGRGGPKSAALEVTLELEGDLTDEQRERIHTIADRCPVHRMLAEATTMRRASRAAAD